MSLAARPVPADVVADNSHPRAAGAPVVEHEQKQSAAPFNSRQSRARTIDAALRRLHLIGNDAEQAEVDEVRLLVLGPDATGEGGTVEEAEHVFRPVVARLRRRLAVWLVGPNVPPKLAALASHSFFESDLEVRLHWRRACFHDIITATFCQHTVGNTSSSTSSTTAISNSSTTTTTTDGKYNMPREDLLFHAAFAFNAGVWGYTSWMDTFRALPLNLPVVVTSYSEEEADSDFDVLSEQENLLATSSGPRRCAEKMQPGEEGGSAGEGGLLVSRGHEKKLFEWKWLVELNPHHGGGSRPADYGEGVVGTLKENAAWQCFVRIS